MKSIPSQRATLPIQFVRMALGIFPMIACVPSVARAGRFSIQFAGGGSEVTLAHGQTAVIELVWDGGPLDAGKTPRRMTGTDLRFDVVYDNNAATPPNPTYGDEGPPGFPPSSQFTVESVSTPIAGWGTSATVLGPFNRGGFFMSAGHPDTFGTGPTGDTPPTVIASFVIRRTSPVFVGDVYVSVSRYLGLPFVYNRVQSWLLTWQYEVIGPQEFDLGQGNPGDGHPQWDPLHCFELFQPLIIHSAENPSDPIADCNSNGLPDDSESPCGDCNADGLLDECDLVAPDCNTNGAPDECDIAAAYSLDCNTNAVPDECDLAAAAVTIDWDSTNGGWSLLDNWCPDDVPNNDLERTFVVTIAGAASQVVLNISPTIDTLSILDGATLEVNDASGAPVRSVAVVAAPIHNDGTIRAGEGRRLLVDASDIEQTANGVIEAVGEPGEPSKIQILGRRVSGGTARTQGDAAVIELLGGAVLEDVIVEGNVGRSSPDERGTPELLRTVRVPNQHSGIIAGTIINQGRIEVDAVSYSTALKPGPTGATLTGGGFVTLRSPAGSPLAELGGALLTFTSATNHHIEGSGILIGVFHNQGIVDANVTGGLLVVDESGRKALGSTGVYRASNGGILEIRKRINHPPDNPFGALAAEGGTIRLRHPKGDAIVVRCAAADATSNGIIELADASRLELTGDMILDSGGIYRGPFGSSSALFAEDILVGSNGFGGELRLTDSMSLVADGNLALNRDGGGCRGTSRGCTPPLLSMMALSDMDLNGSMRMGGPVDLLVEPTVTVTLAGDFDNRCTTPLTFHWQDGPLTLDGTMPQTVEAAGRDIGPDPNGLIDNFAIGTLTLAGDTTVNLVNAFDNQPDGPFGCGEALYVNTLIVESGATLNTSGCHVYYRTLINSGSIPGLGTDVQQIGVPGTVLGAKSRKNCDLPLSLSGRTTDARRDLANTMRTVNQIVVDYSGGDPANNTVSLAHDPACPTPPSYVAYTGSAISAVIGPSTLTVTFTPALENGRAYRLTVPDGGATRGIEFRGLIGDVSDDGLVNATDRSQVVGVWTGGVFQCRSDVDNSGAVNGTDRSVVVNAWTGTQNCAP